MKKAFSTKKLVIAAVCVALCVVLPMAFHAIPNVGSIFSPMHIPVLLCGLVCGPLYGLLCGVIGPLLSSLITGMPPFVYLPGMLIELAVYGLVSGLLIKFVRTKSLYADLYISLVSAMLIGRIAAGICQALIFRLGEYSLSIWLTSYFVTAWPAILLHLLLIPHLVLALEKAKLMPKRYA